MLTLTHLIKRFITKQNILSRLVLSLHYCLYILYFIVSFTFYHFSILISILFYKQATTGWKILNAFITITLNDYNENVNLQDKRNEVKLRIKISCYKILSKEIFRNSQFCCEEFINFSS